MIDVSCQDNLEFLKSVPNDHVDLIYIDPPYNTGRDFGDYQDKWSREDYRNWIGERLAECSRVLKPDGSIYVQCDDHSVFDINAKMEEHFGYNKFRNMITWQRSKGKNDATRNWGRVSDYILYYAGKNATFNVQYKPLDKEYIAKQYKYEEQEEQFAKISMANTKEKGGYFYDYKGYKPPANGWNIPIETMQSRDEEGRINFPLDKHGNPDYSKRLSYKRYLSEYKGAIEFNVWTDIMTLQSQNKNGYPTEKPISLIERIIKSSSNEGDLVLDCFLGSGTTAVACKRLGRRFIGCDINPYAIQLTNERLGEFLI